MTARLLELLDLIARWIHGIAGIMWIGNSMLFNWLDRNLRPRGGAEGVYGDIWLLHSGGFYSMEKNTGERTPSGLRLPEPLHWFKWQAYTTWLSGAALLVVVYYVGGRALLADPTVANLTHAQAVAVAVGTIVGAVVIYELLWRGLARASVAAARAISLALFVGVVYLLTQLLSGRAAFLHVGALLGTIMAASVFGTIVPSQRELVAALAQGRSPSQEIADRAKERSIHNNYITFPVIVLMVSVHFPSLYAYRYNWLVLLVLAAGGALVRHVLNIRFTFRAWRPALAATIAGTILALMIVMHVDVAARRLGGKVPAAGQAAVLPGAGADTVAFDDVRRIIDRRCASCHSQSPADISLGVTPAGVAFDTPEQIRALAPRIRERAVLTRTMPPANNTRMTDEERALLGRWLSSQHQRMP